ncbi:MAG TPA: hypothetical protein VGR89_01035 [Puia sp.]|nr:hypothetical protein [Puia sp.]
MNIEENIENRLWDFIDGLSSPAEKTAVEALITANAEWKRKYSELTQIHQLMAGSQLDEPSMRFTRNVMEEIARHHVAPATKNYINKNIIRGIGAFFLSMIVGLIVFFIVQVKLSPGSTTVGPDVKLPSFNVKVPAVDLGKALGSLPVMLFMFITVVMGLVLLDLYLQRRRTARA